MRRLRIPAAALASLALALGLGAWSIHALGGGLGEPGSNAHDLSATGPQAIHAQDAAENQVCVFCHTPHNANPAPELWNHAPTSASFTVYGSTTLSASAAVLQPSGSSRLCLSCHDGTIAVGATRTHGSVTLTGTAALGRMPIGSSNLGGGGATPDLSDDHPISFAPVPTAENVLPPAGDPVKLDGAGLLQCTSCHDPHNDSRDPNPLGQKKFLVKANAASALCSTCHRKQYWSSEPSAHAVSTLTWNGLGQPPFHTGYTNVSQNACESCHRAHAAPGAARLLKGQNPSNLAQRGEEWSCAPCHNGNVAGANIVAEFQKPYVHPTFATTPSVHDPTESPTNGVFPIPETSPAAPRHVECADCHNPHAAKSAAATPPTASGAVRHVPGVTATGAWTADVTNEYELCLKCHGASANKPQPNGVPYGPYGNRVIRQFDTRIEFQTANPSYHPVFGPRNSSEVPSLTGGWTASSVMYCTTCHGSDSGWDVGGAGPRGPHGSTWKRLLVRRLDLADGVTESASAYALCYACHSRSSIMSDASFGLHARHVRDVRTSCVTCHDPHGVSAAQGNATNNSHLINFDRAEVSASSGRLEYQDTGTFHGACWLVCHGRTHNGESY